MRPRWGKFSVFREKGRPRLNRQAQGGLLSVSGNLRPSASIADKLFRSLGVRCGLCARFFWPGLPPGPRGFGTRLVRLTFSGCRTMMSDMETFTVRDLDRSPKKVLQASHERGGAVIRSRSGQSYLITPLESKQVPGGDKVLRRWLSGHRHWLHGQYAKPIPSAQVHVVDRLVSGE